MNHMHRFLQGTLIISMIYLTRECIELYRTIHEKRALKVQFQKELANTDHYNLQDYKAANNE